MSAALEFLKILHPRGPWALTAIWPVKRESRRTETKTFIPGEEHLLDRWVGELNGTMNLYAHINAVGGRIESKATKEEITACRWLHVDVDPRAGEDPETEQPRMLTALRGYAQEGRALPPTMIVFSGGGYWGLWALKEQHDLGQGPPEGHDERAAWQRRVDEIEDRNRRLGVDLERIARGDTCHDISRIMRLAGSRNLPDKTKIAKGRKEAEAVLVEHHPDRVYTLDDFKRLAIPPSDGGRVEVRLGDIAPLPDAAVLDQWDSSGRLKALAIHGHRVCAPPLNLESPKLGDNSRSAWVFDFCCNAVRAGVPNEIIAAALLSPDLGIGESVVEKGSARRRYATKQIKSAHEHVRRSVGPAPLSDYGNGLRLARAVGGVLRYCYPLKSWLVYRAGRWSSDDEGEVMRLCKSTVLGILDEAKGEADEDRRKLISRWAANSQSKERTTSMAFMGQSEVTVGIADLDADPMLLNVRNGTVDLRTGALRPHDPADLITRQAAVDHVAGADCPGFRRFVEEVMQGDGEMTTYLQRAVGYSLTGDTREQVFFIPQGGGANGKSTLLRIITTMLGDYAHTAQMSAFIAQDRHQDGPNEALAAMRSARLVLAAEVRPGAPLDEQTMKTITGGERIRARFLHQNSFEYAPEFKVWLVVNHLPRITGRDNGMWRRVRVIPFERQFGEGEQDKELADKIIADELPGVLNWALEGCRAWLDKGLGAAAAIAEKTRTYKTESDVLAQWIEDECAPGADQLVPVKHAAASYYAWCERNGERPLGRRALGEAIVARGYPSKAARYMGEVQRCYVGLRLRAAAIARPVQGQLAGIEAQVEDADAPF